MFFKAEAYSIEMITMIVFMCQITATTTAATKLLLQWCTNIYLHCSVAHFPEAGIAKMTSPANPIGREQII
jgi:hypothetical protein